MPTTEAVTTLINTGVTGAVLVLALFAIVMLWRDMKSERGEFTKILEAQRVAFAAKLDECADKLQMLEQRNVAMVRELQQARIDDFASVQSRLVKVVEDNAATVASNVAVLEATHETLTELRQTVRSMVEEVRLLRK